MRVFTQQLLVQSFQTSWEAIMRQNNNLQKIDIIDCSMLQKLTGFNSPSKQAECLRKHNVYYIEGKDGQITTTSTWLAQAPLSNAFTANDKVNLNF
tara:strand:+ start:2055 stop:2342 length:288 start_codon:yes stop_codon:yes gene_type:complete